MFPVLGLFQSLACPERICSRDHCPFSHKDPKDLPPPISLNVPVTQPAPPPKPPPVAVKRQIAQTKAPKAAISGAAAGEPPPKLQKAGTTKRPVAVPTTSQTANGVPILRVNAAASSVAIPVRQTMLETIYKHFAVLYNSIESLSPSLAAEHALKQEAEIYQKSSKPTYRNAAIQCVAAIKRRSPPNSLSHPSVGTEDDIKARAEQAKSLEALKLTKQQLEPLLLSTEDMDKWGYITDIPDGPGGEQPSMEGKVMKCERCAQPFQVSRTGSDTECLHHWGRQQTAKAGGEKVRIYTCCSRPVAESEGCVHGRHVFYETAPQDLHSRHPFSTLRQPTSPDKALQVAAMDCEMIYTTGGSRVARVSVVDGKGHPVFDELVRMDDDVHVIDYITRFSGMSEEIHSKAKLSLASVRKSLDFLINSETILIGHALDNDLKTMRIVHHKCVDTAILFPHRAGPPYRRALRDLVREKLGRLIQTGDATTGHSSAEDAIASLDLVRWHILNHQKSNSSKASIPSSSST